MRVDLVATSSDIFLKDALETYFGKVWAPIMYERITAGLPVHPKPFPAAHGNRGVLYNLSGDQVLKLTSDASEIEAMYRIKRTPSKRLVRVDDVFVVCGPPGGRHSRQGLGVVIREFVGETMGEIPDLSSPSEDLRMMIDDVEVFYRTEVEAGVSEKKAIAAAMHELTERLQVGEDPILPEIGLAIEQLQARGIFGLDFAPRNIAITEHGSPVIFDVGVVSFDRPSAVRTVGCGKNAVPR